MTMTDRYDGMELDMMPMADMGLALESGLGITPSQYAALDGRVQANTDAIGVLDGRADEAEAEIGQRYTKAEVDGLLAGKADRQQEEWIIPTLLNGHSAIDSIRRPRFRKNDFDQLVITGGFTSANNNLPIFVLPTEYIPDRWVNIAVFNTSANANRLTINPGGSVFLFTAGSGTFYLENIVIELDGV